jgi:septal ring factor EnvC (AmiA/AmiB activator)
MMQTVGAMSSRLQEVQSEAKAQAKSISSVHKAVHTTAKTADVAHLEQPKLENTLRRTFAQVKRLNRRLRRIEACLRSDISSAFAL